MISSASMNEIAESTNGIAIICTHNLDVNIKKILINNFTLLEINSDIQSTIEMESFFINNVVALECLMAIIVDADLKNQYFSIEEVFSKFDIKMIKFSPTDDGNINFIYSSIIKTMKCKINENRKLHAQTRIENALLREEFANIQNKFVELENFHHDIGAARFSLALNVPETTGLVEIGSPRRQLTQRLPISARGIVAVDALCRTVHGEGNGRIVVDVEDLSGRILATTSRQIATLVDGWNRFTFPSGVDSDDRDGVLRVRFDDASPDAVAAFSLGPPTPVKRLHPTVGPLPAAEAPLALRVWRGLPDVRPPSNDGDRSRRHVRPGDLPRPRTLFCADESMGYDPVQYWPKEDGFLVHPPAAGVTLGIIEKLPVSGLSGLTAIVHNAHAEGPILRIGMVVTPTGLGAGVDVTRAMTWTMLPPLGWGEVHVMLETPLTGEIDIVLASLVAGGDSNHMAWALFRGFRFCTTA